MATMTINLVDTDDNDSVRMEIKLDSNVSPDHQMTGSMVMLMGMRMLFDSGDVWNAGLIAAAATEKGGDPLALAEAIRDRRSDPSLEEITEIANEIFGVEAAE